MKHVSLRNKIRDIRKETGIGWEVIEQDYVLSWVLYGISQVNILKETLVFKGGTALKKCYFGNYRFSQDLDFSVKGEFPRGDMLLQLITKACDVASQSADLVEFQCNKYPEKAPHPEEQEAFVIHAKFPWHRDFNATVKVEITINEIILLEPKQRTIIHEYGEELSGSIMTYQIEEIISEKIRAILQFAKKLHERGWGRSRVRDYYDMWRILNEYSASINKSIIPELVNKKCALKNVNLTSIEDLFQGRLMEFLNEWDSWLAPLIPIVPDRELVIRELKVHLNDIFV